MGGCGETDGGEGQPERGRRRLRQGAERELRRLGTTFTRYGAGVNDHYGRLRDLFPRRPAGHQTAATVPFAPHALAVYERDVDAMFAAGAQPMITLDAPGWVGTGGANGWAWAARWTLSTGPNYLRDSGETRGRAFHRRSACAPSAPDPPLGRLE